MFWWLVAVAVISVGCATEEAGSDPESEAASSTSVVSGSELVTRAGDALVIAQLEDLGLDLGQPREIEHFLYFEEESLALEAEVAARELGCETNVAPPIPDIPDWGLLCVWPVATVDIDVISEHRAALTDIAEQFGGVYDGWGTPIG